MDINRLHELFDTYEANHELEWVGDCTACRKPMKVLVELTDLGFKVSGGAIYEKMGETVLKCDDCFDKDPHIYQECEVYSRVVGFLRPVKYWNPGKKSEWNDRKTFDINTIDEKSAKEDR